MATERQKLANQRNAQLSTGPKTEDGKNQSRRNALKHGLTGAGVVQSEEDAALFEHRSATWRKGYLLDDEQQEFHFERMIMASVRLTRCAQDELAVRTQAAHRARASWDEDHRRDVERLAARISRKPSLIAKELLTTRHGCEWMLERWRALDQIANWDEAQTSLALDLLGIAPELRSLFPVESLAGCARHEADYLERRLEGFLIDLDEEERELAESGQELTPSRERLRLQRYEAAAVREYYKALNLLLARPAGNGTTGSEPAPAVEPPPPPPPPAAEDIRQKSAEPTGKLPEPVAVTHPEADEAPVQACSVDDDRAIATGQVPHSDVQRRHECKTNPMGQYGDLADVRNRESCDVAVRAAGYPQA